MWVLQSLHPLDPYPVHVLCKSHKSRQRQTKISLGKGEREGKVGKKEGRKKERKGYREREKMSIVGIAWVYQRQHGSPTFAIVIPLEGEFTLSYGLVIIVSISPY